MELRPTSRSLLLEYRGARLVVDTGLIDMSNPLLTPGEFQQFLGELVDLGGEVSEACGKRECGTYGFVGGFCLTISPFSSVVQAATAGTTCCGDDGC